jgi:hypothetical protein
MQDDICLMAVVSCYFLESRLQNDSLLKRIITLPKRTLPLHNVVGIILHHKEHTIII